MAGTLTPSQSYEHVLDVVGGYSGTHDLQFFAAPATGETFNEGALLYVDSDGNLAAGGGNTYMPMWAIGGVNDWDTNSDVGNISGGVVSAYVATGGYELFTTEYDSGETYAPNDLLTADTVTAGYVTKSPTAYNTKVIVGCVSRGTATEDYNQSVLYFWPMFIPTVKTS